LTERNVLFVLIRLEISKQNP